MKFNMPARLWSHGIFNFIGLLQRRLPYSCEHFLAFFAFTYSLIGCLKESVPALEVVWIKCLADLARCYLAVTPKADDRQVWSNVASMWCIRATDILPNSGRIQYRLATVPYLPTRKLVHLLNALLCVDPFEKARESVTLFLTQLAQGSGVTRHCHSVEVSFIGAMTVLYTQGSIMHHDAFFKQFIFGLTYYMEERPIDFTVRGAEIALILCAATCGFGREDVVLCRALRSRCLNRPMGTMNPSTQSSLQGAHDDYYDQR